MKFKRLMRALGESKRGVAGLLELLWISTANNARRGNIGQFTNEEIAIECDWSGDPNKLVDSLVKVGFLDRCETHRLVVHDWHIHSPGFIKAWIKSQKTTFCTPTSDPTSVPPSDKTSDPPSDKTSEGGILNPTQPNPTKPNQTQQQPEADPRPDPWEKVAVAVSDFGLFKADQAIEAAKEIHTPLSAMRIINEWAASPPSDPAVLYNWLAVKNSYASDQKAREPPPKQSKDPNLEWEKIRSRLIKAGRNAGMSAEEIELKLGEQEKKFWQGQEAEPIGV